MLKEFYLTAKTLRILLLCHPAGIFALVGAAFASNCKDAYGMTKYN
jgi:hypothetical protein